MKYAFRFTNLLGTVYRKGNIHFSPDGNRVLSPVGNKVTIFDLKNDKSETLPIETRLNISTIALSPNGTTLILVDESGEALLCSLISKRAIRRYHFHKPVHSIKFSPDGRRFAVTIDSSIMVYYAPGHTVEYNPFTLQRRYYGSYDNTTSIDWSSDSRVFVVGSRDTTTRVYAASQMLNLVIVSLAGHKEEIVGCFFEKDSLDLYTLSRDATLIVWQCRTPLDGLKERIDSQQQEPAREEDDEETKQRKEKDSQEEREQSLQERIIYRKGGKYFFNKPGEFNDLTSCDFHKSSRILVTGFANGSFHIHEMPDFNLIHSLSISEQSIRSVCINSTGDWISFGCSGLGQLLVWEWQSETYILKQQGHYNDMNCLAFSPDGQNIVTGGDDGKVKVWNTSSGFCFVTFSEHTSSVTGVSYTPNGRAIVSASHDGTVRAFDLKRYRNFRTFTSPRPTQFSCVAIDHSGEFVTASSQENFEIYVWSMQTGRLLEILGGHEAPVFGLDFGARKSILASGSWDKTVKIWDVFQCKGSKETFTLPSDVLCVAFRPDDEQVAVACLNAQISFWDVESSNQVGCIDCRHDMDIGIRKTDKINARTASKGKAFTTLCYTADGESILAGGMSRNICLYSVKQKILLKKFQITHNESLDGLQDFVKWRKMSEFGNVALFDTDGADGTAKKTIDLPGVKKGDMSSRHYKPEVRVTSVKFSPTGRSWAATTNEGLLMYSMDQSLTFDPFELDLDITPMKVKEAMNSAEYCKALMYAFRMNEDKIIIQAIEAVPHSHVQLVCQNLPHVYVEKCLLSIASLIDRSAHLEFYLHWTRTLLMFHGPELKTRSSVITPLLTNLQRSVARKSEDLGKICDSNRYATQYIISLADRISNSKGQKRKHPEDEETMTKDVIGVNEDLESSDDNEMQLGDAGFVFSSSDDDN